MSQPIPFPSRRVDAHKGDLGRVLLVGGSRGMCGSIALSAIAALKTGAGLVSAAVPDRCLETVASFHPGVMTIPLSDTDDGQFGSDAKLPETLPFDAVGCGPGIRRGAGSIRLVETLLGRGELPRVLDADAINVMAEHNFLNSPALPRLQPGLVLTPHPGELQRLTRIPSADREGQIRAASEWAQQRQMTIVVKGGPTVVVSSRDGRTVERWTNTTGNPGMATAGSGDVLTGVITALLGQGLAPADAAQLGVFLHGRAGDLAAETFSQPGMTCQELLNCIPQAINGCD